MSDGMTFDEMLAGLIKLASDEKDREITRLKHDNERLIKAASAEADEVARMKAAIPSPLDYDGDPWNAGWNKAIESFFAALSPSQPSGDKT